MPPRKLYAPRVHFCGDFWSDLIGRQRDSRWEKTVESDFVFLPGTAMTPRSSRLRDPTQFGHCHAAKGESDEQFHKTGPPHAGD